uniref:Syntaxin N-terminal domain-containing protein n=1 Tax=Nelumbo nucifera TaxID=4432 RepID=A0A822ZL62_NELNU|nr:TPA_asm: hypothetical protein HUJ06_016751 [Nelumbo nucifera]
MDYTNAADRRLSRYREGTSVDRTRTSVTIRLQKKLKELMDFQELRHQVMVEYKETVGCRYFTVTGEYPEEEVIEKIISSGAGTGGEELL